MSAIRRIAAIVTLAMVAGLSVAAAQNYPNKPVKVIIPLGAGGPLDVMVRALGEGFREQTGQPLIVEPRPGANGIVAGTACKNAEPDGYTLCVLLASNVSLNQFLYENIPYDSEKDFEPITNAVFANGAVVMSNTVPVNSFQELVAYSKANPDKLNYASLGPGGDAHLVLEWLKNETGAKLAHIPYNGLAPALIALARGDAHLMYLIAAPQIVNQVNSGELKAILVPGSQRNPDLPKAPTFAEAGLPQFETKLFFGAFAPAGTPKPVVEKLNSELVAAIHSKGFHERFLKLGGYTPVGNSIGDFRKFLAEDKLRGQDLVRKANVKLKQ